MAKKKDETTVDEAEKVNQPDGAPLAPEYGQTTSPAVLAHQWQKDSPALNTNTMAGYGTTENFIEKQAAAEAEVEEEELEEVDELDYKARTKLDVSDPRYINKSLDHYKGKKKGHK